MKNEPGSRARPAGLPARRCSRCGRVLTDSRSIERGIGPVCAGKPRKAKQRGLDAFFDFDEQLGDEKHEN
nr:DUF6011 domain-containing protein [Candidatus Sigynarchaeota archaeon]